MQTHNCIVLASLCTHAIITAMAPTSSITTSCLEYWSPSMPLFPDHAPGARDRQPHGYETLSAAAKVSTSGRNLTLMPQPAGASATHLMLVPNRLRRASTNVLGAEQHEPLHIVIPPLPSDVPQPARSDNETDAPHWLHSIICEATAAARKSWSSMNSDCADPLCHAMLIMTS
jgi:hypothetical protein